MAIEIIEQHLGAFAALELNDDAHAVLVGLVTQSIGADALDLLFLDQLGDFLDQARLVDLIGQLADDDARQIGIGVFDVSTGPYVDTAAAGTVGLANAGGAVDDAGGGEIGAGDITHQGVDIEAGVVDQGDAGVDHFAQIMRRDIGRHADRDTTRAIHQQIRNARRQNRRLAFLAIVIGHEIDGISVDIGQQFVGDAIETALGVAHRRRRVAVDRTEVTLAVNQGVAQGKILRHAHQGVVDRAVAVRMVFTHHLTDYARTFHIGTVPDVTGFLHREQHTAMHRFQPVAGVR